MRYTTARLLLRPPVEDDVAPLYAIYGDAATNTFNPAGPLPDVERAQVVLAGWRSGAHAGWDRGRSRRRRILLT